MSDLFFLRIQEVASAFALPTKATGVTASILSLAFAVIAIDGLEI